jgi:ribosome-associated toxin RatA of RatAB toxin-antitoxin module
MGHLEFTIRSKLSTEELFNYFPMQIKDVRITKQDDNEIITEEKIVFSTIIKNVISQKSLHKKISDNELVTEIIDGPAKGSIINVICNQIDSGIEVKFVVDLKLSLKAKFLTPLIKKFYKKYLTALVLKFYTRTFREC